MQNINQKLISIIIPTYNSAIYLPEAIQSCLDQTYENIEILICDDGSIDNTKKTVLNFQQKYPDKIKYFKLDHTGSPAKPRNVGMKNAQGEYIAFLDADDIMMPDRLEKQVNIFEKDSNVDIVCSNAFVLDSKPTNVPYLDNNTKEGVITLDYLLENNIIIQSTAIIKKDAVLHIGYNNEKEKFYHEDYEYWLRALSLNKKIYYSPKPLIQYRIINNGISRSLTKSKHIKKTINTFNVLIKNSKINKILRKKIKNQIIFYKIKLIKTKLRCFKNTYLFLKNLFFTLFFSLIRPIKSFRFKYYIKNENQIKLHLGCGENYLAGYVNIDYPPKYHSVQSKSKKIDFYADICNLKLNDNSIDEIRLHHVFEHFSYPEALLLLARWYKMLKINSKLIIETPDFLTCIQDLLKINTFNNQAPITRHIFGSHEASWAIHKDGWYKEKYEYILPRLGYKIINIEYGGYKSTKNITVIAVKEKALSDAELYQNIKNILQLYLIDSSEQDLLKQWLKLIKF